MNLNTDNTRLTQARSLAIPADQARRPIIVPMLGASVGLLYVLIHNLVQLFT